MTFNRQFPGLTQADINAKEPVATQSVAFASLADQCVAIRLKRGRRIRENVRTRRAAGGCRRRVLCRLLLRQFPGSRSEAGDVPVGRPETTITDADRQTRRPAINGRKLPAPNDSVSDVIDAFAKVLALTERQLINVIGVDRMGHVKVRDRLALARLPGVDNEPAAE